VNCDTISRMLLFFVANFGQNWFF